MKKTYLLFAAILFAGAAFTQKPDSLRAKHSQDSLNDLKAHETEYYEPVPPVVTPGASYGTPPSDAVILFDGKNLDQWVDAKDTAATATWTLADNIITVNKRGGDIQTKRRFTDYQLHIEYRIPSNITGSGQARGNSGIFWPPFPGDPGDMSCRCSITITTKLM